MSRRPPRVASIVAVVCLAALPLAAPAAAPRFEEIAGHAFGERITVHVEMVRYLEAIAASPRVELLRQGRSWEERELLAAVITSPENHRRLDEIRSVARRLADPRTLTRSEAEALAADQPVVVWMGGSIHGFELSGSEALLKLAERLATGDDEATARVLAECVVILDPMLNPDGRDAFASFNHRRIGRVPNPSRDDWVNDTDRWQGLEFRTGHYFFDINRDWFFHTQPETRRRIPTLLDWRPQVVVDAHEMGVGSEFYFDPPAEPYGPYFPDFAKAGFERFGAAYARAFDQAGYEYMTGERFNFLYPGYTTSYNSYQGAIGMLYEQGSSRGLAIERDDGSVRTLTDALAQHYRAAWTALETAVAARRELLLEAYDSRRASLEAARAAAARRYFLPPTGDPGRRRELAELLIRNGVEVGILTAAARLEDLRDETGEPVAERELAAGTLVIDAAQPASALLRTLLEPNVPLPPDFLAEARERVDRGEDAGFYDITSWSLPLLFGLEALSGAAGDPLPIASFDPASLDPAPPAEAAYAYLLDGRDAASMAALHELRRRGYRASVLLAASRLGGEEVPRGTVILKTGQNDETLHAAVSEAAGRHRVAVRAVASGLGEPGFPSLGSGETTAVRDAEVALLAEGSVHPYSFGWLWHALEETYRIPVTVLRTGRLGSTPLAPYDVLLVPDLLSGEGLSGELGEEGRERIGRWVRDGGTLVAVGSAVDFVRGELGLGSLASAYREEDELAPDEPPEKRFDVPGAFFKGRVDDAVWLTAGVPATLPLLVNSDRVFRRPDGPADPSRRAAITIGGGPGPLLLSGHAWPESLERLDGAVFAWVEQIGRGRVVLFAEDVAYRGHWRGADRLLLNAVVLGPSL